MTATVTTDLKKHMKYYLDMAFSGETVFVARPDRKNVVMIGEAEYNEYLRLKNNAEYINKIQHSLKQAEEGRVIVKSLEELEEMADE